MATHDIGLQLPTIYADTLQDLLDLDQETFQVRVSAVTHVTEERTMHLDGTPDALIQYGQSVRDTPPCLLRTSDT